MHIKTIKENTYEKTTIKKSIFHAYIIKVNNKNKIKEILKKLKEKHPNSNHIAYAYKITELNERKKTFTTTRYSDDGEPNKTAGYPLLNILKSKELENIIIAVARIFGGIKLGTGGLIKAYVNSGQQALNKTQIIKEAITISKEIITSIKNYNKIKIYLEKENISYKTKFNNNIEIKINIPINKEEEIIKKIYELNRN